MNICTLHSMPLHWHVQMVCSEPGSLHLHVHGLAVQMYARCKGAPDPTSKSFVRITYGLQRQF